MAQEQAKKIAATHVEGHGKAYVFPTSNFEMTRREFLDIHRDLKVVAYIVIVEEDKQTTK